MDNSNIKNKMLWILRIVRYIVRDIDYQLSIREKYAVDEWISSKKKYYVMCDHPGHWNYTMSGGWGGRYDINLQNIFTENFNKQAYLLDINI